MFGFRKKAREQAENVVGNAIREMQEWRPIGTQFQYLGIIMAVTAHSEYWYGEDGGDEPCLKVSYCGRDGVLRREKFSYREFLALKENNATVASTGVG